MHGCKTLGLKCWRCVPEDKLNAEFILPNSFDRSVPIAVAEAVAKAARETGVARI